MKRQIRIMLILLGVMIAVLVASRELIRTRVKNVLDNDQKLCEVLGGEFQQGNCPDCGPGCDVACLARSQCLFD